jgi:hypothetical protein
MKLERSHEDTYDKTFFYTIYKIYFSHNYHVQKPEVQIYISPSLFTTVN